MNVKSYRSLQVVHSRWSFQIRREAGAGWDCVVESSVFQRRQARLWQSVFRMLLGEKGYSDVDDARINEAYAPTDSALTASRFVLGQPFPGFNPQTKKRSDKQTLMQKRKAQNKALLWRFDSALSKEEAVWKSKNMG